MQTPLAAIFSRVVVRKKPLFFNGLTKRMAIIKTYKAVYRMKKIHIHVHISSPWYLVGGEKGTFRGVIEYSHPRAALVRRRLKKWNRNKKLRNRYEKLKEEGS